MLIRRKIGIMISIVEEFALQLTVTLVLSSSCKVESDTCPTVVVKATNPAHFTPTAHTHLCFAPHVCHRC